MKRLFVDMDGTLAVFNPVDTIEVLYEEGYFKFLEPQQEVLEAIKGILTNKESEYEVYILSSFLADSKYALKEKNEWLDQHLPQIPKERRIFCPCGENKKDYVPNGIKDSDFLLDDYTKNLISWEPPGKGIKLFNGINHTQGTWKGAAVSYKNEETAMVSKLNEIILKENKLIDDLPPQRNSLKTEIFQRTKENRILKDLMKKQYDVVVGKEESSKANNPFKYADSLLSESLVASGLTEEYEKWLGNSMNEAYENKARIKSRFLP